MRKLFRKLHLWLSVPFGVVVTLVCFSGAMLVFEDEVVRLTHRELFYAEPTGRPVVTLDEAACRVAATLPEGTRVTGVTALQQRHIKKGIRRARNMGLLA